MRFTLTLQGRRNRPSPQIKGGVRERPGGALPFEQKGVCGILRLPDRSSANDFDDMASLGIHCPGHFDDPAGLMLLRITAKRG